MRGKKRMKEKSREGKENRKNKGVLSFQTQQRFTNLSEDAMTNSSIQLTKSI